MKSGRVLGVVVAGMSLAQAARAEDVNVTTAIDSLKLGAEFKGQLEYNNKGFEKYKGYDPDATSSIDVNTAKIKLSGKINKSTDFKFRFSLLDTSKSAYDYGYVTHWFTDVVGVAVGRQKVAQGGWDNELQGVDDNAVGAYAANLPLSKYADMVALKAKVAGELSLQVFNDIKIGTGSKAEWNKTAHPTWAVSWFGDLGPVDPVVQYGSYDNNKSFWADVGVRTEIAGVDARLDYYFHNLTHRDISGGKADEKADKISSITAYAAYTVKDTVKPWLYVSSFENAQNDKAPNKDAKVNTSALASGAYTYSLNDNALTVGLGADLLALGEHWTPFLAVVSDSGKFADPVTAKEETRSNLKVKLGGYAEF